MNEVMAGDTLIFLSTILRTRGKSSFISPGTICSLHAGRDDSIPQSLFVLVKFDSHLQRSEQ